MKQSLTNASHEPLTGATTDPVQRVASADGTTPGDGASGRKVRIEEVARLADVSPITVSRALRNPDMVSDARRARILDAVARTGYASNPHARALKSGRSNLVALFLSSIASQQYTMAAEACSKVLEAAGYQVVMGRTSYSYARESLLIPAVMDMRPAAAFITGVMELEANRNFLRQLDIPIVESWAYAADPIDMLVGFSNTDGVALVVRHMAERGYADVGFIGRNSGRGTIRRQAFETFCGQAGLRVQGCVTVANVHSIADGRVALNDILDRHPDIRALFCANDLIAFGAMLAARERGLRVPDDLAIVGFGDSDVLAEVPPGITTVSVDSAGIGRAAGEALVLRLGGKEPPQRSMLFPVTLIERGSS
ncbi:LacI family DNA-binding transcriptional regulator [Aureimonas frigidaquae]|uniref:LacI family DNA-binding transcriptional regulator n=1 Tax=Aureimonas frigidaquae TaxID=424757 RepID=UPI0007854A9D|nr:LacI family DNA-binding transcriptional regulator [Aureimonas frigidaquae]